jgi:hypothetical protein
MQYVNGYKMSIVNNSLSTFKELPVDQTRTNLSLSISIIRKSNTNSAFYNINCVLNKTDLSKIDYTEGGTSGHPLEPLNNFYSDNIILYYDSPDKEIADSKALRAFLTNSE